jgi:CRISPR type III-B/RAMP module-associated protein Cmr3
MPTISLILSPADVAMFREGRPFMPGVTGVRSEFPNPQNTSGAIRTWLLKGLGVPLHQLGSYRGPNDSLATAVRRLCQDKAPNSEWVVDARLLGPVLCDRFSGGPYFPVPQNWVTVENREVPDRLLPLRSPQYRPPAPPGAPGTFVPLGCRSYQETAPASGWLSQGNMLGSALPASQLSLKQKSLRRDATFFDFDFRLGIGMDSDTMTTVEGMIYTARFLALKSDFAFRVDLETEEDVQPVVEDVAKRRSWTRWGGEGRVFNVSVRDASNWPHAPSPANPATKALHPGTRFFTYLATPGRFLTPAGEEGGWFPKHLSDTCDLIGAAVGDPMSFSGWDVQRTRPRRTRYAVRAGAVYFWEVGANPIPDPHASCLSDDPEERQAGWGLCLRGDWDYV